MRPTCQTKTGGFGDSSSHGGWAKHHRHRPSGSRPNGAGVTGKPSGAEFGGEYGNGDAAGGWDGGSVGEEDGEKPNLPGATGMPSSYPRPSDSGMGSIVLPSEFAQPTPANPNSPIGSELSPTATIPEAPIETFPIVGDDLGEDAGGSAAPVVPVATPTLTDVEVPAESQIHPAAGIIPIESGSAPAPVVTIPVEGSEPALEVSPIRYSVFSSSSI